MTTPHKKNQSGFTLLEIVIALVVTAILSALMLQAMGTNVQRSATPLFNVSNSLSLQTVMENITADYKRLFVEDTTPMTTFLSYLNDNNSNDDGRYWTPAATFSASTTGISFSSDIGGECTHSGGCFAESPCTENCSIYKVTITQNSSGRNLSALFTQ